MNSRNYRSAACPEPNACFFFSSRRRHTRCSRDWSSDVCSSDLVGYVKLRQEQADLRKQGKYMGIGISTYGEICAIGPSPATPAGGWESATVKIEPSGKITILTGACPHGQGDRKSTRLNSSHGYI